MERVEESAVFRPQQVPCDSSAEGIRISPDRENIAYFVRRRPGNSLPNAICIEPTGRTDRDPVKIDLGSSIASDLQWSPDGRHLAYRVCDPRVQPCTPLGISWTAGCSGHGGEGHAAGQTPGMSFAWMPDGLEIVVASSSLVRMISLPGGSETKIADMHDDGDPLFPPKISISPNGNRIAFTSRRTDENKSRIFVATRESGRWSSALLAEYPGAFLFISPFWSPDSATLGLHTIHPKTERSEIVLFPGLGGKGETIYRNSLLNPGHEPLFVPKGEGIVFYHTPKPSHERAKTGAAQLALLSLCGCRPTGMQFLTEPVETDGWLRFIGNRHLAVNDAGTARLLNLPALRDMIPTAPENCGEQDNGRL